MDLADFKATIESSSERLRKISDTQSRVPLKEGHWSPRQIIGHLIDSATNNHSRFVLAQLNEYMVFPAYDQDAWVELQRYQDESWQDIVQFWVAYNFHLLHVISATPPQMLQSKCTVYSREIVASKIVTLSTSLSLRQLIVDYIAHLKHHLNQVFEVASTHD